MRVLTRVAAFTVSILLLTVWRTSLANQLSIRPVEVVSVVYQQAARSINISALLAYKSTQKLAFKVGGPIARIFVEEGDAVKAGQILAELDKEEVEARVVEAEARFENSRRNVERQSTLYKTKVVSLGTLQDAETEHNIAKSQLRIARFNLRYSVIAAPQDGRIIRRQIEHGELITPNQTAFVMADESRGWVMRTALSDRKVVQVQKGDPVNVYFDPWPLQSFAGVIDEISEAAEERSGLFEVKIALQSSGNRQHENMRLRDGYVGRIEINPTQKQRVVKLPAIALITATSTKGTVFVLSDNETVSSREVRIHYLEDGNIAVSGELKDGDRVITTGADFLQENDKVRVIGGEA